ncbi:MAG: DEAD/DEAH box helicase [Candidatus Micrarchaeaceae archaeon]
MEIQRPYSERYSGHNAKPASSADARGTRERWEVLLPESRLIKTEMIEFREYLYDTVKKINPGQNAMVVLPTGKGKTYVALFAMAKALSKEKRFMIVAPTLPLVKQHYDFATSMLRDHEGVALITGSIRNPEHRQEIEAKAKVIIATPETMVNDITSRRLSLSGFDAVVFDECHKTRGKYAYTALAGECKLAGTRIIALTATPSSRNSIVDSIFETMGINISVVKASYDGDMAPYIMPRQTVVVEVEMSESQRNVGSMIKALSERQFNVLKAARFTNEEKLDGMPYKKFKDIKSSIDAAWMRFRENTLLQHQSIEHIKDATISYHKIEYLSYARNLLETEGFTPFDEYMRSLVDKKTQSAERLVRGEPFKQIMLEAAKAMRSGEEHPKVSWLISNTNTIGADSIIVFAQYRSTVNMLVERLNASGISAKPLTGKGQGVTQKAQQETIKEFSDNKFRVMVCTSIGEEGLDIPSDPMVVSYGPVPSGIRSIQRKGRTGRAKPGKELVLVTKGTRDEHYMTASIWRERSVERIVGNLRGSSKYNALQIRENGIGFSQRKRGSKPLQLMLRF